MLARRCDVLVVAAPHTATTEGLVDDEVLGSLPRGAWVVNLARGALLDEPALVRHLDRGRLGGAVLDAFAAEPLPRSHPLWRHERVLITPHVSGVTDRFWPRETELIVDNVRRYSTGRRLRNIVNPEVGY
jgi:phosphoglycerate dehydrogenase-like enzyme